MLLGNSNYSASEDTANITVIKATPNITLTPNPTTIDAGEDVVLTAVVAQTGSFEPTGTVTFRLGSAGCTGVTLGSDTLSSGQASITTHTLPGGTPTAVQACYAGDSNYNGNSDSANVTVSATGAGISVASNPPSPFYGANTTLTATLVESLPGADPTGTVTLCWGGTALDCSDVPAAQKTTGSISGHVATGTVKITQLGTVVIRASWPGDSNFAAVSDSDVVTVQAAPTNTTMTSPTGGSSHQFGSSVTFTATVFTSNAPATAATGLVNFYRDAGGVPVLITSATLSAGTATTSITVPSSMVASGTPYTIFARFAGSTNFVTSDSATRTITITPATTNTGLLASPNPVTLGASTTLTATVSSTVAGTITGTVNFCVDGTGPNCTGGNLIGTDTSITAGDASVPWIPSSAGTPSIRAYYLGAGNYAASSGAVTVTVNNPVPTISSINPPGATAGDPTTAITITGTNFVTGATVSFDADGTGTGTAVTLSGAVVVSPTSITVSIPAAQLTTAGTATIVVTNPTPGGGSSSPPTAFVIAP